MTLHDAAMTRFSQWWRRMVRSGYAFAYGAYLHGGTPERHWVWESRRALVWGLGIPMVCIGLAWAFWPLGLLAFLVYPGQIARQTTRNDGELRERFLLAMFQLLGRFQRRTGSSNFFAIARSVFDRRLSNYSNLSLLGRPVGPF